MSEYFDTLETRDPREREEALFARLPSFIDRAIKVAPGWKKRLEGVDAHSVKSREALAELPVLRKPELMEAQAEEPPFGGFADPASLDGSRIFMSPGPVWEPQAAGPDPWLAARAFFAAGVRRGELVHNALS